MTEIKPHVQQWKKDEVKDIVRLFNEYPVAGVINMQNLPAFQFMKIRKQLKDKMITKVTKKSLIVKAIEQLKDSKNVENLKQYLNGIPSLIFTKEDPFILYKQISKSKSNVSAKPGQVAPDDIRVEAGPTPFTPGPIIGELGRLGLKTEVKEGKISLKEGKVIVKAGEVISSQVADLLTKLGIEPMTIGLNVVVAYEKDKGDILDKSILSVDEKEYLANLRQAASWSINLAAFIEYGDPEILKIIVKKAYLSGKAVAEKAKVEVKDDERVELQPKVEKKEQLRVEPKPVEKAEQPRIEQKPIEQRVEKREEKVEQVKKEEIKVEFKQQVTQDDVKVAQAVLKKLQDAKLGSIPRAPSSSVVRKKPANKSVGEIINELKDKKSRGEI